MDKHVRRAAQLGTIVRLQTMRFVRQHRSMILLWFTVSILLLLRRLFLFTQTTDAALTTDLSSRIDQRIQSLGQHFAHVNLSVLLRQPPSNQSPSITYRCRHGCGGCTYTSHETCLLERSSKRWFSSQGVIDCVGSYRRSCSLC